MPYDNLKSLPKSVKHVLPKHAQEIYLAAFNSAWDQYKDQTDRRQSDDTREEVAHKVAWAAVKQKYKKTGDKWKRK
jgi:cation transport regulator